jgi:hypothetical protein
LKLAIDGIFKYFDLAIKRRLKDNRFIKKGGVDVLMRRYLYGYKGKK